MNIVKAFSIRSFFWIFFFLGLLCLFLAASAYLAVDYLSIKTAGLTGPDVQADQFRSLITDLNGYAELFRQYYIPAFSVVFLCFGFLTWICCRLSLTGAMKKVGAETPAEPVSQTPKSSEAEKKEREEMDRRLFLHLLNVLQREGRLLDFFSEDLDAFEDDQIGAAVRNIHENCRKVLDKYIVAEQVVETAEEEPYTVPSGFDPNAVKLTGNVTGDPPFNGIVRHRGWKVTRLNMPSLSAGRDPNILAPAEIEIE